MNTLEHAARQALEMMDAGSYILAMRVLREALKPNREGKYYYKDNACTASSADSPDCICWHDEALAEQAEQEPVGMVIGGVFEPWNDDVLSGAWEIYAAPVCTVDLTDDEIEVIFKSHIGKQYDDFARAVIASFKEKNLIK